MQDKINISCFDNYSNEYETWFEKNCNFYEEELEIIKELIGDAQNGLEIGSGSGRFSVSPNIVLGIEPSKNMRDIATSKGLHTKEGVAEKLQFENETFDFTMMMTSICFVNSPQIAINEAFRVTCKGGFVILGFIDKLSELGKEIEKNKYKSKFYSAAKFYTIEELLTFCKNSGFNGNYIVKSLKLNSGMKFIKISKFF